MAKLSATSICIVTDEFLYCDTRCVCVCVWGGGGGGGGEKTYAHHRCPFLHHSPTQQMHQRSQPASSSSSE